jgi:valyl-tRNA synthetase
VTEIRTQHADHKIDRKLRLAGTLRTGNKVEVKLIEQLANVSLTVEPYAQMGFELVLDLPEAAGLTGDMRERLGKDNDQLEKVIANSKRQLENENFVSKAPAKVIETLRAKLGEYEAQLAKNKSVLGA